MKSSHRAALLTALALTWLGESAQAADSLEPAVDTSAPDRLAVPDRPAATPGTAAPTAARAPAPAAAAAAVPAAAPVSKTPPASAASSSRSGPERAGGNVDARAGGSARDRVELENTQITGNRELPKVMYVVPWKRPDLGDFGGRPAKSLLDELLTPVDRDVFKRQNRYFEALQPDGTPQHAEDEK